MTKRYVLDTSAILATWQKEEGSDDVEDLLNEAKSGEAEVFLSFMTFFEAYYVTKRKEGESKAFEIYYWLYSLPTQRVNLEEDILVKAGDVKIKYAKDNISAVDAWIIATALFKDATLFHKEERGMNLIKDLPITIIRIPRDLERREKA
jgi:predicted nucleic acid-binding protein